VKSDKIRFIILITLISSLSLFSVNLYAQSQVALVSASSDEGDGAGETSTLDLFDEDAELTKQGWIQLYVSAGFMYLDGDGKFSARLPDGNEVTIIDFDRIGLKDTDSSYWLSFNWRSANSHWGAWFGSWQFDVVGSREWQDSLPLGEEIPVGASVTSDFDARWYILEATYSLYRSETVDTGIGFGFHTVDLDTTVTARFQVGDQEAKIVSNRLDTLRRFDAENRNYEMMYSEFENGAYSAPVRMGEEINTQWEVRPGRSVRVIQDTGRWLV